MTMTTASLVDRAHDGSMGESDPAERPQRRRSSSEYKARIVDEYDALERAGGRSRSVRDAGPLRGPDRGLGLEDLAGEYAVGARRPTGRHQSDARTLRT